LKKIGDAFAHGNFALCSDDAEIAGVKLWTEAQQNRTGYKKGEVDWDTGDSGLSVDELRDVLSSASAIAIENDRDIDGKNAKRREMRTEKPDTAS
jgi:hypothetical protein